MYLLSFPLSSHNPSIYLSTPSHCVLPVEIKYLICVYIPPISPIRVPATPSIPISLKSKFTYKSTGRIKQIKTYQIPNILIPPKLLPRKIHRFFP